MAQLLNTSLFSDPYLVSYYKLEDTSDSKGSNTLTNTNAVAFNPAKYNNGADFSSNNTNKKLITGNDLGLSANVAMSISCWVKIYNTNAGAFVAHNSTTGGDIYLIIRQVGDGTVAFVGGGLSATTAFTDTTKFHHFVITRTSGAAILGYLDGVQVASFTGGASGVTTNQFEIGDTSSADYGSIIVDDVAIFNKVLTAAEVTQIYQDSTGFLAFM